MPKIVLDKMTAARRQIDAAIRMTFGQIDPAATHTVAAAGNRIVRDLCEARGNVPSWTDFKDVIKPEGEKQFWNAFNASANFLKHANQDPDGSHVFDDEISDFLIAMAIHWYRGLGGSPTREMLIFFVWWALVYPNTVNPKVAEVFSARGILANYNKLRDMLAEADRDIQCRVGYTFLEQAPAPTRT